MMIRQRKPVLAEEQEALALITRDRETEKDSVGQGKLGACLN